MTGERYDYQALVDYAGTLLAAAGLDPDKAEITAHYLVEADLLGHDTHGLALCAPYLGEIDSGGMRASGDPRLSPTPAAPSPGTGGACRAYG